jgi:hypothetical protein
MTILSSDLVFVWEIEWNFGGETENKDLLRISGKTTFIYFIHTFISLPSNAIEYPHKHPMSSHII